MNKQLKAVYRDRDFVTDRLSSLTRYIAFGVLGAYFALMISDQSHAETIYLRDRPVLLAAAVIAILAIIADLSQYIAAYFVTSQALKNEEGGYLYDDEWCSWRIRQFAFFFKQFLAAASALCLVAALLWGP